MLGKKGEDKKPSAEDELVQRVDALMDPKAKAQVKSSEPVAPTEAPPPIDIFKDQPIDQDHETKTAPEIPGKATKKKPEELAPEPAVEAETPTSAVAATEKLQEEKSEPQPETTQPLAVSDINPEIDNTDTDKAVEDIVAHEGDIVLAAEDAVTKKANNKVQDNKPGFKAKLKRFFKSKRTWAAIVVLLIALFAIPQTRYTILGLVIKKQITVIVMDSKTATPVSNAQISLAGKEVKTDANGKTTISAKLGQSTLEITKQYYKSSKKPFFVGFKTDKTTQTKLVATGRQVPITVVNKITGKPVSNADVKVLKTTAKTDKKGKAVVVLPATAATNAGVVGAKGYNTAKVTVEVTSQTVKQNTFEITPTGHVYFLSNQSGKIDVVKTSLDGSGREVILAGTGKEEASSTSLLASRDWRYVVLKSKRESRPTLTLIDTSDNQITEFDSSNANFNLVGWYGHNFIYSAESNTIPQPQSGHQVIKSYDAEHQQPNQLDQSQAEGSSSSYAYQSFDNFYIVNNLVVYSVQWNIYDATGNPVSLANKNDAIRGVQPSGQGKKDYQTFPAAGVGYIQSAQYGSQNIYYAVYNNNDSKTTYYQFENQSVATVKNIDQSDLNKTYPTYLVAPSGNQTLWTDLRDGNNTLFKGDINAKNQSQIATGGNYAPYGWYSDNYVLVSKGNSQLFIMPASGASTKRPPLKVTDYYKPATTFTGYGYGYGGL